MSRKMSLRREVFFKNIDLLLQSNSLHTVEEEYGPGDEQNETLDDTNSSAQVSNLPKEYQLSNPEQSARPLLTQPKKFPVDPNSDDHNKQAEGTSRSPIYTCSGKPKDRAEYSSTDGTGNQSRERLVRPGTPYTEIDESKVGLSKKSAPQMFQFPATIETIVDFNNNNNGTTNRNRPENLPFSPITKDGRPSRSPPSPFSDLCEDKCKACSHQDVVRALPLSPAYARTSTPGPANTSTSAPLCQTISEDSESNMCRICHEGDAEEELISPCDCAGTMGMLHISCLEQWLGSSKTTKCEICQFQFTVLKKPQSVRWYLQEPSLSREKRLMIRDIIIAVCLGLFVVIGSVLCVIFSKKLQDTDHDIGASLLIVVPTACVILYMGFLIFVIFKIRQRFKVWKKEHHVIQITYSDAKHNTSNKIFRRFPVPKTKRKQHAASTSVLNRLDPFLTRFSFESYKAAMYNPILPAIPENAGIEGIEVHTNSSSVISLDDDVDEDSYVRYYQPPEAGNTSILYNETGRLLQETGV